MADGAAAGTRSSRRSTSRSRRSHPSFSDLRLAPLSVAEPKQGNDALPSPRTPGSVDPSTALAYRAYHTSYLAGKSAPSTPGILRTTSRRQQYGGLSRKTPSQDGDDDENTENVDPGYFAYNAVQTASHGGIADHSRGYLDEMPKSMSESGLYHAAKSKGKSRSGNQVGSHKQHASVDMRAKRRSHHGGSSSSGRPRSRKGQDREDDWLSHATMFTTSLLAEGKGQSWVSSHSSTLNLHSYAGKGQMSGTGFSSYNATSDSDFDDMLAASVATVRAREKSRRTSNNLTLPIGLTSDEIDAPLRSPAVSAGWGSRFGSRAASRSNSRRGSRVAMTKGLSGLSTPHDSSSAAYRFGAVPTMSRTGDGTSESGQSEHRDDDDDATPKVMPDFVDPSARAEIQASLASVARQQRAREAAQQRDGGYFAGAVASDADDDDEDHSSSDEAEVARLARTPGFGLGGFGILDRLVGLGNFNIDDAINDDEADLGAAVPSDDEFEDAAAPRGVTLVGGDGDATPVAAAPPVKKSRGAMPKLLPVRRRDAEEAEGQEGQGGWRDAAWLLSVASKILY